MTNYKNHLIIGFISATLFLILNNIYKFIDFNTFKSIINLPFEPYVLFFGVVLIFSVVADIDSFNSKLNRIASLVLIILTIYFILIKNQLFGLITSFSLLGIKTIESGYKFHRRFLHRSSIVILVSVFLFFIGGMWLFFASILGMLTHNLTDWISSKFWREV